MDNKICTKNGCIPVNEYVLPFTEEGFKGNDREFFCKAFKAIVIEAQSRCGSDVFDHPALDMLREMVDEKCERYED